MFRSNDHTKSLLRDSKIAKLDTRQIFVHRKSEQFEQLNLN